MTDVQPSTSAKQTRLERLRNLGLKRNEARKCNYAEVVEEDRRSKLPGNWEIKQKRLEWEEEDENFRADCLKQGLDSQRVRALDVSAEVADRLEARKRRKCNRDEGFASYAEATHRKYVKQTKTIKPDIAAYEAEKEKLGSLAFPTVHTMGLTDRKDAKEDIDRLSKMVTEESEKKTTYSRRRPFDADADIDYINERNKRFNELLERYYGKYTAEIKQNLERGTAI